jgi:hypothetical protein
MLLKKLTLATAAAATAVIPMVAQAESNVTTGASGTLTATARVNFSIVIPRFLFLRVGTGTLLANNTTQDTITFSPTVAQVGTGAVIAGTGGDLTGGKVTVQVIGNGGNVTLGAGTLTLSNGVQTIPSSQIAVAVTGATPHPAFGGSTTFTATGNVVNASGDWTYSYLNATTPAAGTYTGTATYTATMP